MFKRTKLIAVGAIAGARVRHRYGRPWVNPPDPPRFVLGQILA
jgi:hypothetical protein